MTVALDSALDDLRSDEPVPGRPAGWWARAGAFGIDVLLGAAVVSALLLVGWSSQSGWLRWGCLVPAAVVVIAVALNRVVLPAITGWSLGRAVFGIAVVDRDGSPMVPWRLLLRDAAHLLDTLPLFLGWLWPLVDRCGRTFADMVVGTEVLEVDGPRPDRNKLAARVIAGAAALSVLAASLGYALVYRSRLTVDRAREQIAVEGPKIVTDMLSYKKQTIADDFARAQSLVTDGYRPELIKQQDAVRKAPVDNDYWVSNSAVLSAAADRATMLVLLQGQRGAEPNQRFVTASVRVNFEKSDGWKLSDLTVLSAPKPKPEEAPKPRPAETPPKPAETPPKPAPKQGGR